MLAIKMVFITYDVSRVIFKGSVLGGVHHYDAINTIQYDNYYNHTHAWSYATT